MFGNLFQFTSISNGYRPAMTIFTKYQEYLLDISETKVTTQLYM